MTPYVNIFREGHFHKNNRFLMNVGPRIIAKVNIVENNVDIVISAIDRNIENNEKATVHRS